MLLVLVVLLLLLPLLFPYTLLSFPLLSAMPALYYVLFNNDGVNVVSYF